MSDYKRILAVVDLTEDSDTIIRRANQVAHRLGAELALLHVVEYVPVEPMGEALMPAIDIEKDLVRSARERLEVAGLNRAMGQVLIDERRQLPELDIDHANGLLRVTLPTGEPVMFDPAVYFGDRETDIAMTMVFGGFGRAFYEAYESSWPMAPGHEQRLKLYQLYHILNHLNLFGRSYLGRAVDLLESLASPPHR